MTTPLYRDDAYLKTCSATVLEVNERGGIVCDQTVFYATSGGQAGDQGILKRVDGAEVKIATTVKGDDKIQTVHVAATEHDIKVGDTVELTLDWNIRHKHMRLHTALHLLSVAIPLPVTGGSITADKARLDFDMPEAPEDKLAIEAVLNEMIVQDYTITDQWITDEEMEANMDMVKTMSVKPPMGQGRVRLVRIGTANESIDLQPCGGTHVKTTQEIGSVRIGKIEKKGRQNRRVNIFLNE